MIVKNEEDGSVTIEVQCDSTDKIEAVLQLSIYKDLAKTQKIPLRVIVKGSFEQDIQTMWNAVDLWVKHCSKYRSLIELYGHFTEPHPIFEVNDFEVKTDLPSFQFAKYHMDFTHCSVYFPKQQLLDMWQDKFKTDNFLDLARKLRSYRYDIRCHETNIAIPQGVYMVTYPFALPYDKQMNFIVKEKKYG